MTSETRLGALDFHDTVRWLAWDLKLAAAPEVAEKARIVLLDTVACAVAGFAETDLRALTRRLADSSPGGVVFPGAPSLAPPSAAFAASVAACWHEACEGLARAHGRPGLHAVPVAVALGQARGATLGDVLEAIVCGYEVGARAGEAMRIRPGLHVDGTWGVFASTTAATRLLKLHTDATLHALAMAACQVPTSLYAPVSVGRTARNTYVGHAALLGLHLAEAAAAGLTAPMNAFDLAGRALAGDPAKDAWAWPAAGTYLIREGYIKPFAAVRHVHYPAACAMQRRTARGGDTRGITSITLRTYAEALTYCGNRHPQTPIQAQFSLSHGTAFALRTGTLGPEAYADDVFRHPEQQRLERMIELVADATMTGRGARLEIKTGAGVENYAVTSVPGDPDQPLSRKDVIAKAETYMTPSLGATAAKAIIAAVMDAPFDSRFDLSAFAAGRKGKG